MCQHFDVGECPRLEGCDGVVVEEFVWRQVWMDEWRGRCGFFQCPRIFSSMRPENMPELIDVMLL